MINTYRAVIVREETQKVIAPNIHLKQFAIMDIEEDFKDNSGWITEKRLINILENTYYNISDIWQIIYNESKDYVLLVFNKELKYQSRLYNAIKFSITHEMIQMEFYKNFSNTVMSFSSEFDKAISVKVIYDAFCALSKVRTDYAFITLEGKLYPTKCIYDYVSSGDLRELEEIYYE